jgi:hypothetical protein
MSHSITMSTRATPNSMTSPSRVVNFDRFMAPLRRRKAYKGGQYGFNSTALTDGGASARSGTQFQR